MISVLIAPDGFRPRANISTPDELRTGPGVAATTLIDEALLEEAWPAKAPGNLEHRDWAGGIEQLEIGIDKHADHIRDDVPN